jgi:hypothetical protein
MQPKTGDDLIRLAGKRGLYTPKEKQSHPDGLNDLAESSLHTLSINIRKRGSMPAYLAICRHHGQGSGGRDACSKRKNDGGAGGEDFGQKGARGKRRNVRDLS